MSFDKEEIKPETFKTLTLRHNLIKIESRRGLALDLMRFMPGCENKLQLVTKPRQNKTLVIQQQHHQQQQQRKQR